MRRVFCFRTQVFYSRKRVCSPRRVLLPYEGVLPRREYVPVGKPEVYESLRCT